AGNTPTALSQLSSFLSQAVEAPTGWPNILPDDFTILDGIFAAYATVGVTQDIESICAGIIGAENNLGLLGAASENPAELAPGAFGIDAALSSAEKGAAASMHDAVLASAGRAGSIGPMSVPPSWATPSSTPVSALSGAGLTTLDGTDVAEHGTPGLPGVPAGTDKRASGVIPRYGVRLTVMSRPPAAG
ncbi:PE/PPE C-terminal domain-containing protein, partial [Mycobacterium tuberculosis]